MWVDYWGAKGYVGPSSQIIGGGLAPLASPLFLCLCYCEVEECTDGLYLCIYDVFQMGLTCAIFTCKLIKIMFIYIVHEET